MRSESSLELDPIGSEMHFIEKYDGEVKQSGKCSMQVQVHLVSSIIDHIHSVHNGILTLISQNCIWGVNVH